jgi:hypothetical protein
MGPFPIASRRESRRTASVFRRASEKPYQVAHQLNEVRQRPSHAVDLIRPGDDVFYQELAEKRSTVKRFLPTLLQVIRLFAELT